MLQEVKVPEIGESVTGGLLTAWLKEEGESVTESEDLFELDTDKATLAVPSPFTGVLGIRVPADSEVEVGQVVAVLYTEALPSGREMSETEGAPTDETVSVEDEIPRLSPAVRRIVEEHGIDVKDLEGSGKDGRITKADAMKAVETVSAGRQNPDHPDAGNRTAGPQPAVPRMAVPRKPQEVRPGEAAETESLTTRVKLSAIRKRIAERLIQVKQTTALLTTFNEIDMSEVVSMRNRYRETFQEKHGIRLGFMSFFVRASCQALKEFSAVNAFLEEDEIVYNHFYNIGVAVSTDRGLIVPVIRSADTRSFADIETTIRSFADRARGKKLTVDELTGGTFSITNGGVFGSLLSTPLPNPPQTAILGMHAIQKRPVAVEDRIEIRPMMYVALSYDHRLIDGREAVSFLRKIKLLVEDPHEMLLDL